ncbi:hypothetical protein [Piscicoccus intestinalis]|uniref:hypothetical protein n=1 Tax=Piscicoccus intestinalis TaxID=746033 RepID=UPI000838079C|nr:hypothetical protein [Piscicoccus intestinalis]
MDDEPLILESARRHGIDDDDILSAYAFVIGSFVDERGPRPLVMLVGLSTSGAVLEIGVVDRPDYGIICVVHAMTARPETLKKAGVL